MLQDPFEILKSVWTVVGPHFGTDKAPPEFWAHLKCRFLEAWGLVQPGMNGEILDWITLEENCRKAGMLFAGLLLTINVWLLNARSAETPCKTCGKGPVRRWRDRTLKTSCGKVPIFRQEVDCHCGASSIPVDTLLGLDSDDRVSPCLKLWAGRLGASLPFKQSSRFFLDWTGQNILSAQGVHDQVAELGAALPEMNAVAPATTPGHLPERIVTDLDGAVVSLHHTAMPQTKSEERPAGKPVKKIKHRFEVMVARTYERHDVLYGGVHLYRHLAFTGGVGRAGDDVPLAVFNLVNQRFPGAIGERTVYVRGDGAQNIDTVAKRFPKSRRLLDMYHTLVKVTERVKGAFPDLNAKQRRTIDDELSDVLRKGDADAMLARLNALEAHPQLGSAESLERLAKHIDKHRDHLWYEEAKELGLGVGTGITEKDVDLVLDRRFELRGMSWSPQGAQHALRIRLTMFNDTPDSLVAAAAHRQPRRSS